MLRLLVFTAMRVQVYNEGDGIRSRRLVLGDATRRVSKARGGRLRRRP